MARRVRKHKPARIRKRMQQKLWFFFGVICILFVVLIGRLMYIEYTSGEKYEKIVLAQQDYSSTIIPYQRGDIVDAKGTVLATSVDVYNVILDCKVLNANPEKKNATIAAVVTCFPDEITEEAMEEALTETPKSQYTVLAKKVPYAKKQALQEKMDDEENGENIVGIWFEKEYIREYPYGSLAAAMLGFSNSTTGVIGLENEYNSTLSGVNGRSYGYQNEENDLEQTVVQPEDGKTVMTTIDVNIQSIVEKAILDWNEAHRTVGEDGTSLNDGSKNTACLVMNPNTGAILAMATYPTFDLNQPRDLSRYFTGDQVAAMSDEEQMDFLNRLWQNYTITNPFEPGSTFKPFTVAMGLETGKLRGDEGYYCDGYEQFGPKETDRVHCFKRAGHGAENVEKALWDSCNDALMQMSYVIGPEVFYKYQSNFGFGQRTNIDLPGEADTSSLVFDVEQLSRPINLATCSFGQSINVTMVQLATGFCSLINGGYLYQPRIVERILDSSGNVVETKSPVVAKQPISEEVSALLKKYLLGVVTDGTAKTVQVEGYNTGGKTGTAQKIPRSAGTYVVSYISFAPAEHPEVLVYVIVDEPNVEEQDHSSYAMEINHNIMTQIFPYLNIKTAEQEAAD